MSSEQRTTSCGGIVVSDLHLFARRSRGLECFRSLRCEIASAEVLVLNGDIFDFRWSTLQSLDATIEAAANWLIEINADFPNTRVHYILGNHDWLQKFRDRLAMLSLPRFAWHEYMLQLGSTLFLHGDCTDQKMDSSGLRNARSSWENDSQRGVLATAAYQAADRLGLTRLAQIYYYPRHLTLEHLSFHLEHAHPGWRTGIRNCFFGHTHLPFSNHEVEGVAFHNTGSAIRCMEFNPIRFEIPVADRAAAPQQPALSAA